MMDQGVAFGAGKAGQAFDPVGFLMRPQVILRILAWIFSTIVWSCVSSNSWYENRCLYNPSGNPCRFGSIVGMIGFAGSLGLLIGEALFQNISSIKVRKRLVLFDLGFSCLWSALNIVGFLYLAISWSNADYPPLGFGINSLRAAIVFLLFGSFCWAGCAYFAWLRYKSGTDMGQFASVYEGGEGGVPPGAGYSAYAGGTDVGDAGYSDVPYDDQNYNQQNFQAPAY